MKHSITLYFWGIFLLLLVSFVFGFALPSLISAASTELNLIGLFTLILTPVIIALIIWKKIVPSIFKIKKEN